MKRKVIQIADSTQLVSLPRKWAIQYGVKKGDELDIEINGNKLIVQNTSKQVIERFEVDLEQFGKREIRWLLAALYRKGYEEIIIRFNSQEQYKSVQEIVDTLFTGFAIIEQKSNSCTLRPLSVEQGSEFDSSFRRMFLVILSLAEGMEEYHRGGQRDFDKLLHFEATNDKLANFCERIITTGKYHDYRLAFFIYVITWHLEKICNDYKYLCGYFSAQPQRKISTTTVQLLEQTNALLRQYYGWFYEFSLRELTEFDKRSAVLMGKIIQNMETAKGADVVMLSYLHAINQKIVNLFPTTCSFYL